MVRRRGYVLEAVGFVAVLALIGLASMAQGAEGSGKPVTAVNVQFDGNFKVCYTRVHPTFIWDAIASTEEWAELDFGRNFTPGKWFLQPMLGTDFSRGADGNLRAGKLYLQFYTIHWTRVHYEGHAVLGIPGNPEARQSFNSRQLLTVPIGSQALVGARADLKTTVGSPSRVWIGPLLEFDIDKSRRISLAPQWQVNGNSSQYTLALISFF